MGQMKGMSCPLEHGEMSSIGPDQRDQSNTEQFRCSVCAIELPKGADVRFVDEQVRQHLDALTQPMAEQFALHRRCTSWRVEELDTIVVGDEQIDHCPLHSSVELVKTRAGSARHQDEVDWLTCPVCGFGYVVGDRPSFYFGGFVEQATTAYGEMIEMRQLALTVVRRQVVGAPGICATCFAPNAVHSPMGCGACGSIMYSSVHAGSATSQLHELRVRAKESLGRDQLAEREQVCITARVNAGCCPVHLPPTDEVWGLQSQLLDVSAATEMFGCSEPGCVFRVEGSCLEPFTLRQIKPGLVTALAELPTSG